MTKQQKMLSKAIWIAVVAHKDQFDRGGTPYICHPMKVMHYLKTTDEELQCVAILHDVVEDSNISYKELRDQGMSERVVEAVKALTKVPGEEYDEYKQKVFSNIDAMKVKLCDLRHNSDIRRLKGVTEKDQARIRKYNEFFLEIQFKLKEME